MKVRIRQFLRQNHSWSIVGWNIARCLIKLGHDVHLMPTDLDKKNHLPDDLNSYIHQINNPDVAISYTAMHNFSEYLNGGKHKFGIWCYEFNNGLPQMMAKHHVFCDKLLPPSKFARDVLVNGKIPFDKIVVVPHGIHLEDYENKNKYPLKTNKKFKLLVNIAQPHLRKNIPGIFEAFGRAFTSKDDVCLVMKVIPKREGPTQPFDVDFYALYNEFKNKYKNHAEIELLTEFIPDLIPLYNACDALFTMSHGEAFYMPGLEMLAAGKINIAPKHGGQLDYLNKNNSLLIDGKVVRADRRMMYWEANPKAEMFQPNVDYAAELLQNAYKNNDKLLNDFLPSINETREQFTWMNATTQILRLIK